MATSQQTMDYLTENLAELPNIRARKMFGEYALYCDDKVVALMCDDQFFLKITDANTALVRTHATGKPYPGAKDYYLIDENDWDDREYLTELVARTADSLPAPKAKRVKTA